MESGANHEVDQNSDSIDLEEVVPDKGEFDFRNCWYPLAVTKFLDPGKPHPLQILGIKIVVWRDGNGKWRAFEDYCPHRLAPLSQGRVEKDGTLLCSYHAWRFDGEGKCVSIPQCKSKEFEGKCFTQPKSQCAAYPTLELAGLLYVWPDSDPESVALSKTTQPIICEELLEPENKNIKVSTWAFRDVPYGWDYFFENVVDPAHVPVSHHGIVGSRYEGDKYYDMKLDRPYSLKDGFRFEILMREKPPNVKTSYNDWRPPHLLKITTVFEDESKFILCLHASPSRPGYNRNIGTQIFMKGNTGKLPPGLGMFAYDMPTWVLHPLGSLFFHQDMVLLHHQQAIVAERGPKYYTPNPQDKMVILFRRWVKRACGPKAVGHWVAGSTELPKALPPSELFDVFNIHTRQCFVCSKAEQNIKKVYIAMFVLALLVLVLMSESFVLRFSVSGVCALLGYGIMKFHGLFHHYHYEHQNNN